MKDFVPLRSSWPKTWIKGLLTDKKIEQYAREGWYSEEFREARRARMKATRVGNFIRMPDGRMVYSP